MTSMVLLEEFQLDGTVNVPGPVVVMNPRHSPPPMSVKVTLLPGPQVAADANAGKEKATGSASRTARKNATAFCRGIDILKQRVEITRIVYSYKPRFSKGRPKFNGCKNLCYTLYVRLRYGRTFIIRNMSPSGDCFVCVHRSNSALPNACPQRTAGPTPRPRTPAPSPQHPRTTANANEHH